MDKTDRLLDALENSGKFSPEEIEELLSDEEIRETYRLLEKTDAIMRNYSVPDVDSEWSAFSKRNNITAKHRFRLIPGIKPAAAIAAAVFATVAIAGVSLTIHYRSSRMEEPQNTDMSMTSSLHETPSYENITAVPPDATDLKVIHFEDQTLETIILKMCEFYGLSAKFQSDDAKNLRLYFNWDQALPANEVIAKLNNFEQISISLNDNILTIN